MRRLVSSSVPRIEPADAPRLRSQRVAFFTLLGLLLVVLALVLQVFWRFLVDIGLATALALMLNPMHQRITRSLNGRRAHSAFIITLGANAAILMPVVALLVMVAGQARALYTWVMPHLSAAGPQAFLSETLLEHFGWFMSVQQTLGDRLAAFLTEVLSRLAGAINGLLQAAAGDLSAAMLDVALLLIMLFFFLRDGPQFHAVLRRISPLSRNQVDSVVENISSTMQGALASLVVVPLVQGGLATLGYWVLGVPNALLWGVLTTLVAFIPAAGTPLVWMPICIYLWLRGEVWQSLFLAAFGALVVSTIDNVLRPLLLKGTAHIHPLWSLLAILGGMFSFGALGLLVGPLVLSLGVSALHIYEREILGGQPLAPGNE